MSLKSSNKVDTNRYELVITIDEETFKKACDEAFKKNIKSLNVPGFRRGKAPKGIVEKMYGEDVFYNEAFESVYPGAIDDAAEEANVEIVDFNDVEFHLISMDKSGVEFSVKVTVKPEVEIGEYKGLKAQKPSVEPTEEDVQQEIDRLRERNSRMVSVEDRAAQNDDIVVFDFEGSQIVGHNTDDEFDVNVTFPEDYHAEELKGKEAVFKCKLHEIKMRELPEVDDEFAKDVSEFDTLDALKEDIKAKTKERKEKEADTAVESELIEALIKDFKAEIPQAMIDTKINDNLRDFDYSLQMQGLNLQQYMQYMNLTLDQLKENYKEQSEKQVKIRLALEKVAQLENIVPTAEDIDMQYKEYADMYKMDEAKVRAAIPEKELVKDLAVKKASELIKENAKITDAPAKKDSDKKEE